MVECVISLDTIFDALGNATRRDILRRVARKEHSIHELARVYTMSFAGVAKHVETLTRAGLVRKRREGKEQIILLRPRTLQKADAYLRTYEKLWETRFSALDEIL